MARLWLGTTDKAAQASVRWRPCSHSISQDATQRTVSWRISCEAGRTVKGQGLH
jgi:hypothetical protein